MKNNCFWGSIVSLVCASSAFAADATLSLKDGLEVGFTDHIKWSVGLRLQSDSVQFNDDITPLEDDTDFRRARIITKLNVGNWHLGADYDEGISEGWKNVFIQYRGLRKQRITIGNQTAPFSMEDLSSSMAQPFMERSVATALSPGMLQGMSYRRWGDNWSVNGGFFGDELSELDRRRLRGESVIVRGTYAPIINDNNTVHFGISGEVRNVDSGEKVGYKMRPGTRLSDRRLITTRSIENVDKSDTIGFEFAASHRDLRVQAETIHAYLDAAEGDLHFNGQHITVSKVISGGNYRYSHSSGVFIPVRPQGSWGALELAARYARLDLTDDFVEGGEQTEATLAASWIINRQLRATVNYSFIEADPNRNGDHEDVSLLMMRLQFEI